MSKGNHPDRLLTDDELAGLSGGTSFLSADVPAEISLPAGGGLPWGKICPLPHLCYGIIPKCDDTRR